MFVYELLDEELIALIDAGSQLAEKTLYNRYHHFSHLLTLELLKEYIDYRLDYEEVISVIYTKLPTIISNYHKVYSRFHLYWKKCARNAFFDYLNEIKDDVLGGKRANVISTDEVYYEGNRSLLVHDVIGVDDDQLIANDTLTINILKNLVYEDDPTLNAEEKLIAHYIYFRGYKTKDILERTPWSRDHVNYLVRNTKDKIIKILKSVIYK